MPDMQSGTAIQVPLSEVAEGAVLGADLLDSSGNVLLPVGTVLSMTLIESLRRRGVATVPLPDSVPMLSEAEWQAVLAKAREDVDRLFRHSSPDAVLDRLRDAILSYRLSKLRHGFSMQESSGHDCS